MQRHLILSGLIISAPGIVHAQLAEPEAYPRLAAALHRQVELLSSITGAESARSALPELKKVMAELESLNRQVDSEQLWRYIENTPDLKQPLLEDAEQLLVELQRLEIARCYSVRPLQALLRPLLIPAA